MVVVRPLLKERARTPLSLPAPDIYRVCAVPSACGIPRTKGGGGKGGETVGPGMNKELS